MRRLALGRGIALGLGVLAVLLTALPHAAAQEVPPTGLDFVAASPYVAQAGGTYTLKFTMPDPPADAELVFAMGYSLSVEDNSRDVLDAMVAGTQQQRQLDSVTIPAVYFPFTQPGAPVYDAAFKIEQGSTGAAVQGFVLTDPGVYPFTVTLRGADGTTLDSFTTYMIVLSATTISAPMALAPIIPFSAPLALQPDGSYVMSDESNRQLSALREAISSHPDAALTVDPSPETVDALGVLDDPSAPTPEQLALAVGSRSVLAGPYVDLDANAWAAAGLTAELSNQLTLGAQVLQSTVAGGRPLDTGTWVARSSLTTDALDRLKAIGIDRLVLEDGVGGLDGRVFDGRRLPATQFAEQQPFDIENGSEARFRAVTADRRLAARLSATDDPALNAQLALADLALVYCGPVTASRPPCQTPPGLRRGVVLDVDPSPISLASFKVLLDLLAVDVEGLSTPMVSTATVRSVLDLPPAEVNGQAVVRSYDTADPATVPDMNTYRTELRRLSPLVGGYQSMVATTDQGRGTAVRRLLDVSGAAMEPSRQEAYLLSANHQVVTVTDAILAPAQEPSTLTSTDAELQVRVENRLDYPVTIRLEVSSDKLEFADGRQRTTIDQVLAPKATTGVKFSVRARASGTFSLDTRITSPDTPPTLLLDEGSLEVRSTAVSQLGLVLTISAGFFLLAWWIKHFRATRRSRKLVDPDDNDAVRPETDREHEPA